jgi:UDP-3-O-[3-hydroxymyristoyl] glucosamine N-acyltransferase
VSDNARVSGDAQVYGDARVSDNARVSGDAQVYGDARVSDNARVSGDAQVYGDAQIEAPDDCKGIINERYGITILPESIQIGCQLHKKREWWDFTDREILAMDGKSGLVWWKKWKPILMAICEED